MVSCISTAKISLSDVSHSRNPYNWAHEEKLCQP